MAADVIRFSAMGYYHLRLGLEDLCANRIAALLATNTGKTYEKELRAVKEEICALPAELVAADRPISERLRVADRVHDDWGAVLRLVCETYERMPGASPELLAACSRVRAAFVPSALELRRPYAEEAARSAQRKGLLGEREADLRKFPLADVGSLHTCATRFIEAGDAIEALLKQQAVQPNAARPNGALRSRAIGLLNQVREVLDAEVRNLGLAADLDAQVFEYFDELERRAAATREGRRAGEAKASAISPTPLE